MAVLTFPVTLKEAYMLSRRVKHFIFETPQAFHFQPGQFITVHFEFEGKILRRSYSIANRSTDSNTLEFAAGYTESGPGTALLFNLKPGEQIQINGPFGRLILKENLPKRYILTATSTGITPYRSMINELCRRMEANPELKTVILQGVQSREDLLYGQDFMELAERFPQVMFRACFSRGAQDLQPWERSGYVQQVFDELDLNPADDLVYLCGNPGMIDQAFEYLKERAFDIHQVIREKYISK